jgi:hypothetical protein
MRRDFAGASRASQAHLIDRAGCRRRRPAGSPRTLRACRTRRACVRANLLSLSRRSRRLVELSPAPGRRTADRLRRDRKRPPLRRSATPEATRRLARRSLRTRTCSPCEPQCPRSASRSGCSLTGAGNPDAHERTDRFARGPRVPFSDAARTKMGLDWPLARPPYSFEKVGSQKFR